MKWYVIRTAAGKEKKMKEAIENELKLLNVDSMISNLLIPTQKNIQIRKGKKVHNEKTLFPGYLFVECDKINDLESLIKHIKGISSILKQPLTQTEVDRMLGKDKENSNIDYELKVNQKVQIIDGPFKTFNGLIKELDKEKQKAKISVSIFETEVNIDLDFSQILQK
jgi:transcriptional antiterminator NusG